MAIISKKSDYHYSDLSRWGSETVGSDIYPLRPTEQKRVLKFCDVAFLAEALYSRNRAGAGVLVNGEMPFSHYEGAVPAHDLSPKLDSGQFFAAYDRQVYWGSTQPVIELNTYYDDSLADFRDTAFPGYLSLAKSELGAYNGFVRGKYLSITPIKSAFDKVAKFKDRKYAYQTIGVNEGTCVLVGIQNEATKDGKPVDNPYPSSSYGLEYFYGYYRKENKDGSTEGTRHSIMEYMFVPKDDRPLCEITVDEPAKSGVKLDFYICVHISTNISEMSFGSFIVPASVVAGSRGQDQWKALILYMKDLLPAPHVISNETDAWKSESATLQVGFDVEILCVLSSNVDINYDA